MTLLSKHLFFLPMLIWKMMYVKITVMGSIGTPELDFKYCFSLGLHLSQSRLLQQVMLFALTFLHCGERDLNGTTKCNFFRDRNYTKGFQRVILSTVVSFFYCTNFSLFS